MSGGRIRPSATYRPWNMSGNTPISPIPNVHRTVQFILDRPSSDQKRFPGVLDTNSSLFSKQIALDFLLCYWVICLHL